MKISILSVFPDLYQSFLETSLIHRAQENNIVSFDLNDFFTYVKPKERIDSPAFGHGAGMLIRPEVVENAIGDIEARRGKAYRIFFSPAGKKLDQPLLRDIVQNNEHIMLVAGRYEGMDDRVEQAYADLIVSVGDFVLMGGDLPAMMLIEGALRLLPGVVGKESSVIHDSFTGSLVDYPSYTHPVMWQDLQVPDVVRSGNHGALQEWRHQQAVYRTVYHHFAWLRSQRLTKQEIHAVKKTMPQHYVVLMHSDVLIGDDRREGTTSVTSIDIHDIARSSMTYGITRFFIVTPLIDQQKMVQTLLDFWTEGEGVSYNYNRHSALSMVTLCDSLDQVVAAIEDREGKKPLLVATSARAIESDSMITFEDQEKVWCQERPVLFIFGTGKGLSPSVLQRVDFTLIPVHGFSDFNHLSVRSAVAIIIDRWLGISEKSISKKVAE